jgi:hypothetical protein
MDNPTYNSLISIVNTLQKKMNIFIQTKSQIESADMTEKTENDKADGSGNLQKENTEDSEDADQSNNELYNILNYISRNI